MKTLLLTGASGDIGTAIAKRFAAEGYAMFLIGNSSFDKLKALADALSNEGVRAYAHKCDVSNPDEVRKAVELAVNEFGGVDLLINNAGMSIVGLDVELKDNDWQRILNTNLSSCTYFCRNVINDMLKRNDGKIINVSSMWGHMGASCEAAYSATKGGMDSYTKSLAKEYALSGIAVNAIALGAIDTKMNGHLSDEEKSNLCEEIPIGRMATTKEAADFIYLISQAPKYLTGQIIGFDGGY